MSFENINYGGTETAEKDLDPEKERAARTQKVKAALQRKLIIGSIEPGMDLGEHASSWIEESADEFGEWFNKKAEEDFDYVKKLEGIGDQEDEKWDEVISDVLKQVPTLPFAQSHGRTRHGGI
jgi:hypothetical protein